ncbi:uncharacterized protein C8Q71DRAFT_713003 [Rhodofomes roseus]|uniref:Transmembrane protein n=1 Tax=Rhodofomes roseus TaxID=34475 RepID=A0A4Y9Z171_9APHY|nr:uncharacterized protein C8Q71DRAFT_713003 [Rhodofomes roseus]KAH9833300.1 hypothetical protein C8Q71DRAFT_713003 [Rhodofomes roseus]TFY67139.1 hypothetical protein EVJ58_g1824 [Rhodofomes roseus]
MPASKWSTPEELAVDEAAFIKLMHCLAGVYFWEFLISLDFDWELITGKKKFQWPLIFYLLGRYCLFFALIGILIALDATTELNCQALYTFDQLAGDAAVGLASINLSIRTMAVWSQNRWIVIPLVLVILGHWSLILQGVLLTAEWIPGQGCAITKANNTTLAATFIYSMCFDALVMVLSVVKLWGRSQRSQLVSILFKDGLIYFLVALLANSIATAFMVLNLNAIMAIIFNVPAAIASTIVACRAVRRLSNFANNGPEIYTTSASHSGGVGFRSAAAQMTSNHGVTSRPAPRHTKDLSSGVHVQMQTFTIEEAPDNLRPKALDLESAGSETDVGSPVDDRDYKAEAL